MPNQKRKECLFFMKKCLSPTTKTASRQGCEDGARMPYKRKMFMTNVYVKKEKCLCL
jgi:hypothetical protein